MGCLKKYWRWPIYTGFFPRVFYSNRAIIVRWIVGFIFFLLLCYVFFQIYFLHKQLTMQNSVENKYFRILGYYSTSTNLQFNSKQTLITNKRWLRKWSFQKPNSLNLWTLKPLCMLYPWPPYSNHFLILIK